MRKEQSDLDVPLPDKTEGKAYLRALREHLPTIIDSHMPDMIFYLAGVDVLETDKLGRLALTKSETRERDNFVLTTAHNARIPVAVAMGGGYSERIADIVEAHANTFRVAQEVFF